MARWSRNVFVEDKLKRSEDYIAQLENETNWIMKYGTPKAVLKVFKSKEFKEKFIGGGIEQGSVETRDFSSPAIEDAYKALITTEWPILNDICAEPHLTPELFRQKVCEDEASSSHDSNTILVIHDA